MQKIADKWNESVWWNLFLIAVMLISFRIVDEIGVNHPLLMMLGFGGLYFMGLALEHISDKHKNIFGIVEKAIANVLMRIAVGGLFSVIWGIIKLIEQEWREVLYQKQIRTVSKGDLSCRR